MQQFIYFGLEREFSVQKNSAPTLVVAAVLYRAKEDTGNEVLIVRRGPGMSGAGHWEFPGGKVEAGETETQALEREIFEELCLTIRPEEFLGENLHQYPSKKICLRFYLTPMPSAEFVLTEHDGALWVTPDKLHEHTLADADVPIIQTLRAHPKFR